MGAAQDEVSVGVERTNSFGGWGKIIIHEDMPLSAHSEDMSLFYHSDSLL